MLALVGARHIVHVSRIGLNPIRHLLALVGARHIVHVSRIGLNTIRHLLALVGARHIVHVSRVRVNAGSVTKSKETAWETAAAAHGENEK